jgi:hypothetical protein
MPDSELRYAIPLPDIGISLDDHDWIVDQPYRT